MKRPVFIQSHQNHIDHLWEVQYPGILDRCVKCKVYKFMWDAFKEGRKFLTLKNGEWI